MTAPKDIALSERGLVSGHRACSGCGFPQIVRIILSSIKEPVVAVNATGCLEVTTTIYPYSAWNIPWMHSVFANTASTMAGIETAYQALKKKGKIKQDTKFIAFGGDGGTYDIGLQAISGAFERGHDFVYCLYDNNAYQNTGNQRSGATPMGSSTTTTPDGKEHHGKEINRKDMTKIAVAHKIPYAGQSALHAWSDLHDKAKRAFNTKGPSLLAVLQPCNLGWKFDKSMTVEISRLAVETCFWPLYEVVNGVLKINYFPKQKLPIIEFLKHQGRFKHILKNQSLLNQIQDEIDNNWKRLNDLHNSGLCLY